MKIVLIIPWKASPSREKPLKAVLDWYKTNLPDIEIVFANASEDIWLPSASRNIGVKRAQEARADVIIMNDADTIPEIESLLEAINAANNDKLIHLPYMDAKYLTEKGTNRYIDDGIPLDQCGYILHSYPNVHGGVWVFTPDAWWEIGGMDEAFKQWGYEDNAFQMAHQVIKKSDFVRHSGSIYCFNHREQIHDNNFYLSASENRDHFMRYFTADTPEKMLKLVRGY